MAARLLTVAALWQLALAFSNTVPWISWSSYRSSSLESLPSNPIHSQNLLESLLLNEDICGIDAIILIEQEGLHASDLRTLSPSSKLVSIISESKAQRQLQYVSAHPDSSLAGTAQTVSTRCGLNLIELSLGSTPGRFSHESKNIISIKMPSLEGQRGGTRKDKMTLYSFQLADELEYLAQTYPKHLVVYSGSSPQKFLIQNEPRQQPDTDDLFNSLFAPTNTTLAAGGILKRYQLLTPGLIIVLLVTLFILLPVVLFGFKALASIQSPLKVEAPKGYSASEKKSQ